ncbi:MAG: hypothetical protein HZB38_06790, partial [Planctomycetes bacterium]|nr:hypothetical protein [Planctomycetota bacterium]
MIQRGWLCKLCALALLCGGRLAADDAETLMYTLTPRFGEGRIRVELTWETGQRSASVLSVA